MMMVKPCGGEGRYGRCRIGIADKGREASAGCLFSLKPKPHPPPLQHPKPSSYLTESQRDACSLHHLLDDSTP